MGEIYMRREGIGFDNELLSETKFKHKVRHERKKNMSWNSRKIYCCNLTLYTVTTPMQITTN